jgi:RNA polymerase sigma-70 factor (ECF subfamily)
MEVSNRFWSNVGRFPFNLGRMMSHIQDLLQRIQNDDQGAVEEFVRTYEPYVRKVVRARLNVARLRRFAGESDFCQLVLGTFVLRAAMGQYVIADSEEMKALLGRITRNKIADVARRAEARKPHVPLSAPESQGLEPRSPEPGPGTQLAWNELLQKARDMLTPEEREVSELRTQGLSWEEVAARLNATPDAVRKRLDRAMARVIRELKLEEDGDG